MKVEGFGLAVAAAQRWLTIGRDVLVLGDRGAGKSTVLAELFDWYSRRGASGLLVRSAGPSPLAALLDHPSAPQGARGPDDLAAWLIVELADRGSVLLVDDLDRVDDASAAVIRRALGATECAFVAAYSGDPIPAPVGPVRDVLTIRQPAEVHMQPFGYRAMASLLESALGAPADTGLTSAVLAQTGGNPRAAVALLDGARAAGLLEQTDGVWGERVGENGPVVAPADAVLFLFLSDLGADEVAALEVMSVSGPLALDPMREMFGPDVVASLAGRRRLIRSTEGDEEYRVAPPVLARGLRARLTPYRWQEIRAALADVVGSRALEPEQGELSSVLLHTAIDNDEYWRWTADLAGRLLEQVASTEAELYSAWTHEPTLRHANAYLATLLRRPAAEELAEVFTTTRPDDDDAPADRAQYAYYRARWARWSGAEVDTGTPDLEAFDDLRQRKTRGVQRLRDGLDPYALFAEPLADPTLPPFFADWPVVTRAAAFLEAGLPGFALQLADEHVPAGPDPEPHHYLAAIKGESLLMLGRITDAERWERRMLDAAYDDLDALGIRVHACVLAEVLCFLDQGPAAWRVVSTGLRLGAAGPIETTYHRRALAVGATLQVQAGNLTLAKVLRRDLDGTPAASPPLVRALRVLADVGITAASGDPELADAVAWEVGTGYADQGLHVPALLAWVAGVGEALPGREQRIREVLARIDAPALEPYGRLLLAVAAQDVAATAEALPDTSRAVAPGLVARAEVLLGRATESTLPEPLSAREYEVALLARQELSNREIAGRLHLSVRTVENHMSRVLRKLGYESRSGLVDWDGD